MKYSLEVARLRAEIASLREELEQGIPHANVVNVQPVYMVCNFCGGNHYRHNCPYTTNGVNYTMNTNWPQGNPYSNNYMPHWNVH